MALASTHEAAADAETRRHGPAGRHLDRRVQAHRQHLPLAQLQNPPALEDHGRHHRQHAHRHARGEYGPLTYGKGYIQLPSGLFLQYYGLHGEAEVRYDDLVVHEATYLTRQGRSKIYGGLLTENCIAGNTQVLTDVGWVAIGI